MDPRCYVFFDVDDTLVEWTVSWRESFATAAREVGVEVGAEQAWRAVERAFGTYYNDCLAEHAASGDEAAFWRDYDGRILSDLGVPPQSVPQAAERVIGLLKRPEAIRLYDEVPEVLKELSDGGLRLGIVTGRPKAEPDLHLLGVRSYFDPLIDAFSVGSSKSVGRMFHVAAAVAAEAGLPAWHVGDNYDDDILGAQAAGMKAVLIERKGRAGGVGQERKLLPCRSISDLRDLIPIVLNGEVE
ncbi:MAG: HAD family hydrolase [Armatimonadota bacterium]